MRAQIRFHNCLTCLRPLTPDRVEAGDTECSVCDPKGVAHETDHAEKRKPVKPLR